MGRNGQVFSAQEETERCVCTYIGICEATVHILDDLICIRRRSAAFANSDENPHLPEFRALLAIGHALNAKATELSRDRQRSPCNFLQVSATSSQAGNIVELSTSRPYSFFWDRHARVKITNAEWTRGVPVSASARRFHGEIFDVPYRRRK